MAFSSSGALPKQLLEILLRTGKPEFWPAVYVGCSGTFRTERTLLAAKPGLRVHSCDVSLFSTAIASLVLGPPLDFRFTGDLAFIEAPELDDVTRVASIMVASTLAGFITGKTNRYKESHAAHLRAHWADYVAETAEKLTGLVDELPISSYAARDFTIHVDEAIERGAGVISFPPMTKGVDAVSTFLNKHVDWPAPSFRPFDPATLPALLDKLDDARVPYFIASDQVVEDRPPTAEVRVSNSKTLYAYQPVERSAFYRHGINEEPFAYTPLDVSRLHKKSKIAIVPSNGGRLNFLKNVYLKKSIAHVTGQGSFEVYIDGMLAGGLIYAQSRFIKTEVYLLSDFSTSRSGRIAKLIARLATTREVVQHLDLTFLQRFQTLLTTAFSDHPAAMKYRGSWEVRKREAGPPGGPKFVLNYESLVREETLAEAYRWWFERDGKDEVAAARDRVSSGPAEVAPAAGKERPLHGPDRVQAPGREREDGRQADVDPARLPA